MLLISGLKNYAIGQVTHLGVAAYVETQADSKHQPPHSSFDQGAQPDIP